METAIKSEAKARRHMTCDELAKTGLFRMLAPKMQKWVLTYVQGFLDAGKFDHVAATRASYKCKNDNSARAWGCQIRMHPKVRIVVDEWLQTTKTKAELNLEDIQRQIAAAEPGGGASAKFWAMKRDIEREMQESAEQAAKTIEQSPPAKPEPVVQTAPAAPHRFKVGETCIVNGKPYTVTKVDDEGKALAGEPQ
jgi:hypothetical protein